jgi:dephospho-CoA kinase
LLRVGLTGGVACGKTTVAEIMRHRGAHVVFADDIAHQLMRPGEPVYDAVVQHFGSEVVATNGEIDRKKLADAAFSSGRVNELNGIVHPAVISRQESWMEEVRTRDPQGIAVVEAALLLETGISKRFDKLVVVICPRQQKVERFAQRQNLDLTAAEREVTRRTAAQLPDEEKVRAADYVIENTGSLGELERKVDGLMADLRAVHT